MDYSLFHQEKNKKQMNFRVQISNFLQLDKEKEK